MITPEDIAAMSANPAVVKNILINSLEAANNNEIIYSDPANPFISLMEMAVHIGTATINANEPVLRRQYAALAQTEDDLYMHMTDADAVNRFAKPSELTVMFSFDVGEVKSKARDLGNNTRQVTIPRDTNVTVDGITFTLQYPINIRIMAHGGFQVVYDTIIENPLGTVETNNIEWQIVDVPLEQGIVNRQLVLSLPMKQFKISTHYDQTSKSKPYVNKFAFEDQFHYARVFNADTKSSAWVEMETTHSLSVYDATNPTAILKVAGNLLTVSIPQIYFTGGAVRRALRVDIYTTKGNLVQSFERYSPEEYTLKLENLSNTPEIGENEARELAIIRVVAPHRNRGGRSELPFEDLRERVINNSLGKIDIPITPTQINSSLEDSGYKIVKDVDNVTDRIYKATKTLPLPPSSTLKTAIGSIVTPFKVRMDTLINQPDSNAPSLYVNRDNLTIGSGTLFELIDTGVRLLSASERRSLMDMSHEQKIIALANRTILFNPFDYVLNTREKGFELNPYYLDSPKVTAKIFKEENRTTLLDISTLSYGIERNLAARDTPMETHGYDISIIARIGDTLKERIAVNGYGNLHVRLSFKPNNDTQRCYLNGVVEGVSSDGNLIISFSLASTYDVSSNGTINFSNFTFYNGDTGFVNTDMTTSMDLQYIISDYATPELQSTNFNSTIALHDLPADATGIIHEELVISFGDILTGLWSRGKAVLSGFEYQRHTADVLRTHTEKVYARDANGSLVLSKVGDVVTATTLHEVGDPYMIDGEQAILHRAGDVVIVDGSPVIETARGVERQLDIFLLDVAFLFADAESVETYRAEFIRELVTSVTLDLADVQSRLLENTELWYHPTTTIGNVPVVADEIDEVSIDSEQRFTVTYYLSSVGFSDLELRSELTLSAGETIAKHLSKSRVSVNDIATDIATLAGGDAIDVTVKGLGGAAEYSVVTIIDDSKVLTMKKRPFLLADGSLSITEDITVEFVKHT